MTRSLMTFMNSQAPAAGTLLLGALLLSGCNPVPADKFVAVQKEAQAAREEVSRLENQLADEQKTTRHLQEQLANVRGQDAGTMDALVTPAKIQLASRSGGYNEDGKAGDDGIILYVQPVDKEGDVIKAAGSIKVTLLDLTRPTTPVVVAPYEFDVANTRKLWHGRFMTNHFTIRCPWPPSGPPAGDEVTARIEFHDLLTGRVLTAQEVFKIVKGPTRSASQPG